MPKTIFYQIKWLKDRRNSNINNWINSIKEIILAEFKIKKKWIRYLEKVIKDSENCE